MREAEGIIFLAEIQKFLALLELRRDFVSGASMKDWDFWCLEVTCWNGSGNLPLLYGHRFLVFLNAPTTPRVGLFHRHIGYRLGFLMFIS